MKKQSSKCSEKELQNLDIAIINFILPRLKEFQKTNDSIPFNLVQNGQFCEYTLDEYNEMLSRIIDAFEQYLDCASKPFEMNAEKIMKIQDGLFLFFRCFSTLWK